MSSHVSKQAAEWLQLMKEPTEAQKEAFTDWVRASPEHLQEFLLAMTINMELGRADWDNMSGVQNALDRASDNVVQLSPGQDEPHLTRTLSPPSGRRGINALSSAPRRERGSHALPSASKGGMDWRRWGWAASVAAISIGALTWWMFVSDGQRHSTDIGEQRTVELTDKSVVNLNSRSSVVLRFSGSARDVTLDGEAMFKVGRDPMRPFRVHSGGVTIQALGTQFNVRRLPSGTTVAVVEGAVRVSTADASKKLIAGEEARVDLNGRIDRRAAPEIVSMASSHRHRLVFRDNTLEDIAAEFNRWNRRQIHIEGGAGAGQLYDGAFDADDPASLIEFLRRTPGLAVEDRQDRLVIRPR